jgi:thiamine pyrophosphate-dependent acetolactate synthase large subunit-like protein
MPAEIVALTRSGARFVALTTEQAATIAAEVAASLTGALA